MNDDLRSQIDRARARRKAMFTEPYTGDQTTKSIARYSTWATGISIALTLAVGAYFVLTN